MCCPTSDIYSSFILHTGVLCNSMKILPAKLDALYDAALALVYPQVCAVCEGASVEARRDAPACARCWQRTRVFTGAETLCWKCGAPSPGGVTEDRRAEVRCRRCDAEEFTAARGVGVYELALRAAVLALKREPYIGARVVSLLREAQQRPPLDAATLVLPVPLHRKRERERGFNQASVLARSLASAAGLPFNESSLVRATHTEPHRAGMDARARRESVADAFQVTQPRLVKGERILLIDDVFTTGATVSACAAVLRAAGAEQVFVLTVARA